MSYALVTGASKGLGKAIATELAARKINLLLVARSEDLLSDLAVKLKNTYEVEVHYKTIDLSEASSAGAIRNWINEEQFTLSILVNNAGYGLWGYFEQLSLSDQQNMIRLNVDTLVGLTYELLPLLKQTKQSYILNVASTAAYQAVPTISLYAASKAFVLSFTRGLRFELRNTSVSVTCLCPGATNTDFVNRAGMQAIKETAERFGMAPEAVAKIAVKGLFNNKSEIIPGFINKLTAFLTRILPKIIMEKGAFSIYDNNQ